MIELGIIMALLLSWQFTLAEFAGGPIMIVLVAVAFRLPVRQRLIHEARVQAGKGLRGSMEGQRPARPDALGDHCGQLPPPGQGRRARQLNRPLEVSFAG